MFRTFSKKLALGFVATTLLAGTIAVPSIAGSNDWERVDEVRFTHRDQEHSVSLRGDGRFDRIAFRAKGTDIRCRDVRIIYRNGHIQYIGERRFNEDHLVRFDLNGDDRRISEVHFDCRPLGQNHGRLVIRGRR